MIIVVDDILGGCDVEKNYAGPTLPQKDGKFSITHEFVKEMIQWFKDGKTLPKRYVWEIVLGAHDQFAKEESLVEVDLPEGVTCDVIGDVHGAHDILPRLPVACSPCESLLPRPIL
jgi:serine/threonine-protein phosphatase 5